jgi:hypothetical protein
MPTYAVMLDQIAAGGRCPTCERLFRQPRDVRWKARLCKCAATASEKEQ